MFLWIVVIKYVNHDDYSLNMRVTAKCLLIVFGIPANSIISSAIERSLRSFINWNIRSLCSNLFACKYVTKINNRFIKNAQKCPRNYIFDEQQSYFDLADMTCERRVPINEIEIILSHHHISNWSIYSPCTYIVLHISLH